MAYGSISGITKDWSQNEINDASQGGMFFKSAPSQAPYNPTPPPSYSTPTPLTSYSTTSFLNSPSSYNNVSSGGGSSYMPPANTPPAGGNFGGDMKTYSGGGGGGGGSSYVPPPSYYSGGGYTAPQKTAEQIESERQQAELGKKNQQIAELTKQMQSLFPAKIEAPVYNNRFSDAEFNAKIAKWQNAIDGYNAVYDPSNDPTFQTAVSSAEKAIIRSFARRGMSYSNAAKGAIAQKNAELAGQFQDREQLRRKENINNLANELGVLTGIEKEDYNKYRDKVGDVNTQNTTNFANFSDIFTKATGLQKDQFNQDILESGVTGTYKGQTTPAQKENERKAIAEQTKTTEDNERQNFGTVLTPQIREQIKQFENMPQMWRDEVNKYYNKDLGAEINRRAAEFPDDPLIPWLKIARTNKIARDPELLSLYGNEIGLGNSSTAFNAQAFQANKFKNISSEAQAMSDQILAQTKNERERAEINRIYNEIANLSYDAAKRKIEVANLPDELKLKLDELNWKIEESKARVDNIKEQTNTEIVQQGKISADTARTQQLTSEGGSGGSSGGKVTTQQKNESFSQDYNDLKNLSVAGAVNSLENDAESYIAYYGYDGYKKLWNAVLESAIDKGQGGVSKK